MKGTSQAVLASSDRWKVLASLSLFLKSEKIRALLSIGACRHALLLYIMITTDVNSVIRRNYFLCTGHVLLQLLLMEMLLSLSLTFCELP